MLSYKPLKNSGHVTEYLTLVGGNSGSRALIGTEKRVNQRDVLLDS